MYVFAVGMAFSCAAFLYLEPVILSTCSARTWGVSVDFIISYGALIITYSCVAHTLYKSLDQMRKGDALPAQIRSLAYQFFIF